MQVFQPIGYIGSGSSSVSSTATKQTAFSPIGLCRGNSLQGIGVATDKKVSSVAPCDSRDTFAAVGFKRQKHQGDVMPTCAASSIMFGSEFVIEAIQPTVLATASAGSPSSDIKDHSSWWIQKVLTLPMHLCTGWVVAQAIDEYSEEARIAELCSKETYTRRIEAAGLKDVGAHGCGPRAVCKAVAKAQPDKAVLLDESGQLYMLAAIGRSLASYAAGIRCWAAFRDAMGDRCQFPASERSAIQYVSIFQQGSTMDTYLKHLRWAHRFLRMENGWDTPVLRQVCRGRAKLSDPPKQKLALQATDVRALVKHALKVGDVEQAAILAAGRLFLFRVPSECIPLELNGQHSQLAVEDDVLTITLMRRKNTRIPSVLRRKCCCAEAGRHLCALHLLAPLIDFARSEGCDRVFTKSAAQFIKTLRDHASALGIANAGSLGSHSLRRGMASDIIDAGGSLAVLLKAGDWRSAAFLQYLRDHQIEETAASQLLIAHSDSE